MTSSLKFSRANDILGAGLAASPPPSLADLVGSWLNTNPTTGEIARLTISECEGRLLLSIEGAGPPGRIAWPETPAIPYVARLDSAEVTGFEAHCNLGFMETHLAANLKHGVLVIQSYNRFKDGSGQGAYFTREFFHQNVVHEHVPTCAPPRDDRAAFMMAADVSSGCEHTTSVELGGTDRVVEEHESLNAGHSRADIDETRRRLRVERVRGRTPRELGERLSPFRMPAASMRTIWLVFLQSTILISCRCLSP